jgi:small subunit ribosomal protein S1
VASKKAKFSKSSHKEKSIITRAKREEPTTMEELLAGFETPIALNKGQKVKGKITAITKKNVVVDIGGKSEGMVAERAFVEAKDFIKTLKVGDEITTSVLIPETPEGFTILSLRSASYDAAWKKLEDSQKTGNPIRVLGKSVNSAGVMVEIDNLSGFIPTSLLGRDAATNTQALIGNRFEALVIEADRDQNKIVLSERDVSEKEQIQQARDALLKVKEGEIYEGVVTKIYTFGSFVKIKIPDKEGKPTPVEGLVHVSELSWEKVTDPKEIVSEKDKVKVKVIGKVGGKLALSIKQAQRDPWEDANKKFKKDAKIKGKVVKISDYGVFVQLIPGVEGLVHMTKIPPGEKLEEGKDVNVYVEEIDSKARKLSLGLVLTRKPIGYK